MVFLIFKLVVKQNKLGLESFVNNDDQTDLYVEGRLLLDKFQYTWKASANRLKEDNERVPVSFRPMLAKNKTMTATDDGHFYISVVSDRWRSQPIVTPLLSPVEHSEVLPRLATAGSSPVG